MHNVERVEPPGKLNLGCPVHSGGGVPQVEPEGVVRLAGHVFLQA